MPCRVPGPCRAACPERIYRAGTPVPAVPGPRPGAGPSCRGPFEYEAYLLCILNIVAAACTYFRCSMINRTHAVSAVRPGVIGHPENVQIAMSEFMQSQGCLRYLWVVFLFLGVDRLGLQSTELPVELRMDRLCLI